jgi:NAD(P)-dependent dehydrogenase (short-subunit alcohol dehydrogenase family)
MADTATQKTALVTGATTGIGRETARQLLALGWRVLVHGRTQRKAAHCADELAKTISASAVDSVAADLSDMGEVVKLAQQIRDKVPRLDALINNAGVFEVERQLNKDGMELTMAVNHFAPFLLSIKLLPLLLPAQQGRVVTVSSVAHQGAKLDVHELDSAAGFDPHAAYAASKLANILFTKALAKRLADTSVTANCLHPGAIDTRLLHKGWGAGGAPVERGAQTSVYLATSDAVSNTSGGYFTDCRPVAPSRAAHDPYLAEALWNATVYKLQGYLEQAEIALPIP